MDIRGHNRVAWDRLVEIGNQWTVPVTEEIIRAAKSGQFEIYMTPIRNYMPTFIATRAVKP